MFTLYKVYFAYSQVKFNVIMLKDISKSVCFKPFKINKTLIEVRVNEMPTEF